MSPAPRQPADATIAALEKIESSLARLVSLHRLTVVALIILAGAEKAAQILGQ